MKLSRMVNAVRRSWLPSLVIGAVVGLLAAIASFAMATQTYTATNTLLFQVAGQDEIPDPSVATNYATTQASSYSAMVTSPLVLQPLSEKLDMDPATLEAGLLVVPPRQNLTMRMSYISADEQEAMQVVTEAGKILDQVVADYTDTVGKAPRVDITKQQVNTLPTPGTASSPVASLAKGAIAGLMAMLAYLVFKILFNNRVHTVDDLAEVTDSSVIATLRSDEDTAALARSINYLDAGRPARIQFSTATAKEDCSAAVAGVARRLAADKPGRVAVVDANLRRPEIGRALGVEGAGLSELLSGQVDPTSAIHQRDGLTVVPAGGQAPNPAELLASARLGELVDALARDHDVVLVNGGSLVDHSDGALSASASAGTVLVVGTGRTSEDAVREAVGVLESVDARLLGLVLARPTKG
ncbi:Wzz/FepE/Etk N-terminal domain-containing protein [Luteococcus sp. Sow4_B9]|uniref:Wzz/FepE/Etk N-terminal domain-containing protein n=1 Tax=Luteococcus sp. Sow4_B9 TaxID=3438792 RepID=UPI003F9B6B11